MRLKGMRLFSIADPAPFMLVLFQQPMRLKGMRLVALAIGALSNKVSTAYAAKRNATGEKGKEDDLHESFNSLCG